MAARKGGQRMILTGWINRHRGLFLYLSAYLARAVFIGGILFLAWLASQMIPQTEFNLRQNIALHGPQKEVIDVTFNHNSEWLAGASKDGRIYLWDFLNFDDKNSRDERNPIYLPLETGFAQQVLFTPDGKYLISGGTDLEIRIWQLSGLLQGQDALTQFDRHQQSIESANPFLDFYSLKKHTGAITHLRLSADGRWLASGDQFGKVYVWDLALLPDESRMIEQAITIDIHRSSITDIEFSLSNRYFAVSDLGGTISLYDLTLASDAYQFINSRYLLQERESRAYDLAFDLSYQSDTPSVERHLFAAGPDGTIFAYDLNTKRPIRFPDVHETAPIFLSITRDMGSPAAYWLASIDAEGVLVLWDLEDGFMFQAGGARGRFYQMKGMRRAPTGLITSINYNHASTETPRHLLITTSIDHTAQVINLNVARNAWRIIQLRAFTGRVNDAAIDNDHHYIATANRDRTVRIWNAQKASTYNGAIASFSFFRFMVPIALGCLFVIHTSSTFLMDMYHILIRPNAVAFIFMAVFGLDTTSVLRFLISLFVPLYPTEVIENGRLLKNPEVFSSVDVIGGPARVVVHPGNVVAFQTNRMQTNVVTNTTYYLRPFERIRNIISLEDHYCEKDSLETYTRDGIQITLKNVRFRYRVKFNTYPKDMDRVKEILLQSVDDEKERQALEAIMEDVNRDNLHEYRSRLTAEAFRLLRTFLQEKESTTQRVLERGFNPYDNVDRDSLQTAARKLDYPIAVEKFIQRKVRHFINIRPLDFFTAPQRIAQPPVKPQPNNPNGWVREQFRRQVLKEAAPILKEFGVELLWIDVGNIEINRESIKQTRKKLWEWRLRRHYDVLRKEGESRVVAYREIGRIKGEADVANAIIESLNTWQEHLEEEAKGAPDEVRAKIEKRQQMMITSRIAEILRHYLRDGRSDGTNPPPWMEDPNDPSKPKN
jgi:WD40 repeat protein